jgi:ATP-binding cassette subfamily B protein
MNRAVYKHLLLTYGRRPGVWFGVIAGLLKPLLLITFSALVIAQLATHIASGDIEAAKQQVWYLFLVNVAGVLVGAIGDLVSMHAENAQCEKLMLAYYKKLTNKDMAFYRDHQTGYLTGLFRQYVDGVMLLVRLLRIEVARAVVALFAPVIILTIIDWRIGLVALGMICIQLVYIIWTSAKANKYRERSHEIYRKVTAEVADAITNIVAFKSSGMEQKGYQRMARLVRQDIEAFWLRRRTTTLLDTPRGVITAIGLCGAFYMVLLMTPSSASVGLIVLIMAYMLSIIRIVNDLPNVMTNHDDLITKAYPTLKYLGDTHETIRDPAKPRKLRITAGAIHIKDVDFSYPSHAKSGKEITVFKKLNINIKGGEHVGIVGLSGAGKSTLASLLLRFDDVRGGSISIDGFDIRKVKQSDLHRHIAYVPQEPLLFHKTIRENIVYFNGEANQAQLQKAAKAAHAHEFIATLPDGYDTIVGERGVKLSGGQKQRVVIARAILKNAPIMIFDEATSALDTESEKIIQQALPHIIGKHTAIVIAHRLSTIAGMDRILVMHAGEVIEEGTHEQLLKQRGRYYSLWQKQIASDRQK